MEIRGWDYAPDQCSSNVQPIFYFVPNRPMVDFLRINGFLHVPVNIDGTFTYDGTYFVRVDKQPETDLHVGFLPLAYLENPPVNGTITLVKDFRCKEPGPLTCVKNGCCVR